jgi:hypothetical protein
VQAVVLIAHLVALAYMRMLRDKVECQPLSVEEYETRYEAVLKNPLLGPFPQSLRELTYSSPYPTPLPLTQASEEKGLLAKPFQG